jgi:hypothetical protein
MILPFLVVSIYDYIFLGIAGLAPLASHFSVSSNRKVTKRVPRPRGENRNAKYKLNGKS